MSRIIRFPCFLSFLYVQDNSAFYPQNMPGVCTFMYRSASANLEAIHLQYIRLVSPVYTRICSLLVPARRLSRILRRQG